MRNVLILMQRELAAAWGAPSAALILAASLMVNGLMFNAWALGDALRSSEVLERFFFCSSGTTLLTGLCIAMRLLAEERQQGTLTLLQTAPLHDWQLVLGKFGAGLVLLGGLTLLTLYMPALVLWHGKIAWGQVAAGYVGLLLLGAATLSLGLIGSAVAPNQLVAVMLGAVLVVGALLLWLLARVASPPLDDLLAALALHDRHFRPFMRGIISLADVVYYLSLSALALGLTTRLLEARRWR